MIGLWYPRTSPATRSSKVRKYPARFGRPNSLLNAAPPIGPSNMICSADAIRPGLLQFPVPPSPECTPGSQGWVNPEILRLETEKPLSPALGFAPRPVAPSSRISPPTPVAAPGKGEIAVG